VCAPQLLHGCRAIAVNAVVGPILRQFAQAGELKGRKSDRWQEVALTTRTLKTVAGCHAGDPAR